MCVSVAGGHRHARKGSEHSESLGSEDVWSVLGLGYCNSYKHGLVSIPTRERKSMRKKRKRRGKREGPENDSAKMLSTAVVLTADLNSLTVFGVSRQDSAYIGSV